MPKIRKELSLLFSYPNTLNLDLYDLVFRYSICVLLL